MRYVDNNLMPGEQVVYDAKIHWFIFAPSIIWFALAICFLK